MSSTEGHGDFRIVIRAQLFKASLANEPVKRSSRYVIYDYITKYTDSFFVEQKREKLLPCKSFSHVFNKKYWRV